MQALHYKWSLLVTAHMDYDIFEEDHTPVHAARRAEQTAAAEEPMLRELLDANEHTSHPRQLETQYLAIAGRATAKGHGPQPAPTTA